MGVFCEFFSSALSALAATLIICYVAIETNCGDYVTRAAIAGFFYIYISRWAFPMEVQVNPSVSMSVVGGGGMSWRKCFMYIMAQLAGAVVAQLAAQALCPMLFNKVSLPLTPPALWGPTGSLQWWLQTAYEFLFSLINFSAFGCGTVIIERLGVRKQVSLSMLVASVAALLILLSGAVMNLLPAAAALLVGPFTPGSDPKNYPLRLYFDCFVVFGVSALTGGYLSALVSNKFNSRFGVKSAQKQA